MKNKIFNTFTFAVGTQILNNALIKSALKSFYNENIDSLKGDQQFMFLFKISFLNEEGLPYIRTLGTLIISSKNDFSKIYKSLCIRLDISDENYKSTPINELIFNYKIFSENIQQFKQPKLIFKK